MTPHDSPPLIRVGNREQPSRRDTDHFMSILHAVGADHGREEKKRFWGLHTVNYMSVSENGHYFSNDSL